jgi:hypothetical protein
MRALANAERDHVPGMLETRGRQQVRAAKVLGHRRTTA